MVVGMPKSPVDAGGFWMSSSQDWAVVVQPADSQSNETEPARQLIYKLPHGFKQRAASVKNIYGRKTVYTTYV